MTKYAKRAGFNKSFSIDGIEAKTSYFNVENGRDIDLTPVEFQITEYLFSYPEKPLDRTDILKRVWGESFIGEEKIVDVNIRRLRIKIEDDPSNPVHVATVWGFGYKWGT